MGTQTHVGWLGPSIRKNLSCWKHSNILQIFFGNMVMGTKYLSNDKLDKILVEPSYHHMYYVGKEGSDVELCLCWTKFSWYDFPFAKILNVLCGSTFQQVSHKGTCTSFCELSHCGLIMTAIGGWVHFASSNVVFTQGLYYYKFSGSLPQSVSFSLSFFFFLKFKMFNS